MNQATQIEPELLKSNQISLIVHSLFQALRSLQPRPPSSLDNVIVSQATLAEWLPSVEPCHKKALHGVYLVDALLW